MITINKGNPEDKGIWFLPDGECFADEHKAIITCPNCDHPISLKRHSVDDFGHVFPSVVCINGECNFHKYIQLAGWEQGYLKRS